MIVRHYTFPSHGRPYEGVGASASFSSPPNCAAVGPDGSIVRFPPSRVVAGHRLRAAPVSAAGPLALPSSLATAGASRPSSARRLPRASANPTSSRADRPCIPAHVAVERLFALAQVLLDAGCGRRTRPPGRRPTCSADEDRDILPSSIQAPRLEHGLSKVVLWSGVFDPRRTFSSPYRRGHHAPSHRGPSLVRLEAPPVFGAASSGSMRSVPHPRPTRTSRRVQHLRIQPSSKRLYAEALYPTSVRRCSCAGDGGGSRPRAAPAAWHRHQPLVVVQQRSARAASTARYFGCSWGFHPRAAR